MAKKLKKQERSKEYVAPVKFDVKIPKGYEVVTSGDFSPIYIFSKKGESIEGEITKIEKSKHKKFKKSRIATVRLSTGKIVSIWSSFQLEGLYDEAAELLKQQDSVSIFMQYQGEQKIKGQKNPMKLFVTAISK